MEVLGSPEKAAARGAALFANASHDATAREGIFTAALSGGSTPVPLFRRLARMPGIDWARVHLFWADERCVPPDHPESNYRLAHEQLLSEIPPPGPVIHRIRGELPPEEAARAYEEELDRTFPPVGLPRFDLIFLGVGGDGHTASLFPGFDPARSEGRTAVEVEAAGRTHPRVTLTLGVINRARRVVFLATGADKARIVAEVLEGTERERYPAGLVAPTDGTLTWLLDREAAGELNRHANTRDTERP